MDVLWSPWRFDYIKSGGQPKDKTSAVDCVFCLILENSATDEEKFILHRAEFCFVILNIYPYISGHLMIVPYVHVAELDLLEKVVSDEMMDLAKIAQTGIREEYRPEGFNIGMNIGKAAGAGVANHLHLHILPRWIGDSNFMTAIGQTRTIPEDLRTTYEKLKSRF